MGNFLKVDFEKSYFPCFELNSKPLKCVWNNGGTQLFIGLSEPNQENAFLFGIFLAQSGEYVVRVNPIFQFFDSLPHIVTTLML